MGSAGAIVAMVGISSGSTRSRPERLQQRQHDGVPARPDHIVAISTNSPQFVAMLRQGRSDAFHPLDTLLVSPRSRTRCHLCVVDSATGKSPECATQVVASVKVGKRKFPWKQPRRPRRRRLRSSSLRHSQCCFRACSLRRLRVQTRRRRRHVPMASPSPLMARTASRRQSPPALTTPTAAPRVPSPRTAPSATSPHASSHRKA